MGIQSLIDETPMDVRAENFKESGNEAYKLSLKMKKDWTEATAKRAADKEAAEKEREKTKAPAPVLSPQQEKAEASEVTHLAKLHEAAHKRLLDAVTYYSQGLDVEHDEAHNPDGTARLSKRLKAQILVNRALVHLALQNYGRAQND